MGLGHQSNAMAPILAKCIKNYSMYVGLYIWMGFQIILGGFGADTWAPWCRYTQTTSTIYIQ